MKWALRKLLVKGAYMSDMVSENRKPVMRTFETGATRNLDVNKLDFEGFYSPLAMESFAKYMHSHRMQKDGTMRAADNWQKGIGFDVYMKSMFRHFFDAWKIHRGHKAYSPEDGHELTIEEALNAMTFNSNGYLHELLKAEAEAREDLAAAGAELQREVDMIVRWSQEPDVEQSDAQCEGADMMTIKLPANLGVLICATMLLTGATYLILRVILMMQ